MTPTPPHTDDHTDRVPNPYTDTHTHTQCHWLAAFKKEKKEGKKNRSLLTRVGFVLSLQTEKSWKNYTFEKLEPVNDWRF